MKKLKMAIIGAGQIAQVTHIPNYKRNKEVELVAICDNNLETAKYAAQKFDMDAYYSSHIELLDHAKPDAVTVCVPNKFHCQIVKDALLHGCHVLCEKPPAITAKEAREMEALAREKNLLLSYGFHFRHSEQVVLLKQMIEQQEMGEIYHAEVKWNRRRGIPGWGNFTSKEMQGGGPLIDIGAHMLDVALYLMGYPEIAYVSANASDRLGKKSTVGLMGTWDVEKFTIEDGLFGFVQFKNGSSLQIQTSFALNCKERDERKVFLFGSKAGASVFPLEIYGEERGQLSNRDYPFMEMNDLHEKSSINFANACLGKEKLLVTAEQGSYIQELVCTLYQSAERKMPCFMDGNTQSLHIIENDGKME